MKLIIDIDENLYSYISKEDAVYFPDDGGKLFEAVRNGTPLPKEHGDLIDRDELLNSSCIWEFHRYDDYSKASKIIKNMPTIIEADKENKK